jgi:protein involved in polysaccharide export with SLBB domain
MDRIYPIKYAQQILIVAGATLAFNFGSDALGQLAVQANPNAQQPYSPPPAGVTSGIPTAQPVYAPTTMGGAGAASMLNSMDVLNDRTKLKSGDTLSYRVIEEQNPQPALLTVSPTGDVEVPLLGQFPAAGKTCRQLANQLKPLLEKNYFFKATVIIGIDTQSQAPVGRVFITGQVKEQGAIDIPANEVLTVSHAILLDGGLADFADRNRIRLLHRNADGTTTKTIVNLKKILDQGHAELDPVVQAGDTIDVPQRTFNF